MASGIQAYIYVRGNRNVGDKYIRSSQGGAYLINRAMRGFIGRGDQVHQVTLYKVLGAE